MSVGHKAQESKVRWQLWLAPVTLWPQAPVEEGEGAGMETVDFRVFVLYSQISHLIMSYLIWNKIYSLKNNIKK